METRCTVRVNLSDLCLDISLSHGSAVVLKKFDSLAEVLDSFLVGLLAELVVTLFFEAGNLLL